MLTSVTVRLLVAVSIFLWLHISGSGKNQQGGVTMADELLAPTVGIALTATFGTLSIRNPDGSFQDIGRINGSDRYISMIQRLSSPEQKHLAPPYSTMEEMWADLPREGPRAIKRALGLPASSDVRILTELLKPLLDLYPTDEKVRYAVIAYPPTVALYEEDIIDAAAYLNVRVQGGEHLGQPREVVAAYAGYRRGLCKNPGDKEGCSDEQRGFPEAHVLHVEYTTRAMAFHVAVLTCAQSRADWDIDAVARYDLGGARRHDDGYLLRIERDLATFLTEQYTTEMPEHMVVIITGEWHSLGNNGVQDAIRRVLKGKGVNFLEVLVDSPEYIAARGAAELCWRGREFYSKG